MTSAGHRLAFLLAVILLAPRGGTEVCAQAPVLLRWTSTGPYRLVERSDWSRWDDGKYSGHVYREVRANIAPGADSRGVAEYRGNFYVLEETLRDLSRSAGPVDAAIPAAFRVAGDGTLELRDDRGFPSLRGFPSFPSGGVTVGSKWTARGFRAADPRNDGSLVVMPLIAEYEYRGIEAYKGESVHRVFARYATRYKAPSGASAGASAAASAGAAAARMRAAVGRKGGDPFVEASGTHEADILLRVSDGLPLMMRDRLDETFRWSNGASLRFKGFTLTFSESSLPLDRGAAVADLKLSFDRGAQAVPAAPPPAPPAADAQPAPPPAPPASDAQPFPIAPVAPPPPAAEAPEIPPPATIAAGPEPVATTEGKPEDGFELAAIETGAGIDVQPTEEGVKLTVRDIRFVPDSAEILPAERGRLDLIAAALRRAGNRTFLVEGHTAAIGKPSGELELSKLRAKRIADELAARGVPAELFLYKGWGGTKPIDTNTVEAGRARNRRVEITILE